MTRARSIRFAKVMTFAGAVVLVPGYPMLLAPVATFVGVVLGIFVAYEASRTALSVRRRRAIGVIASTLSVVDMAAIVWSLVQLGVEALFAAGFLLGPTGALIWFLLRQRPEETCLLCAQDPTLAARRRALWFLAVGIGLLAAAVTLPRSLGDQHVQLVRAVAWVGIGTSVLLVAVGGAFVAQWISARRVISQRGSPYRPAEAFDGMCSRHAGLQRARTDVGSEPE